MLWEEGCVPQDLLVPVLFRLRRENLTPTPRGFWKSKGHVLLASPSSESILCRNRFLLVLNRRDDIVASMELAVCQAPLHLLSLECDTYGLGR